MAKRRGSNRKDARAVLLFFAAVLVLAVAVALLTAHLACSGRPPAVDATPVSVQVTATPSATPTVLPSVTPSVMPSATPTFAVQCDGAPTPAPTAALRTATIRAVGDLMMHKEQLAIAAKRGTGGSYDFHPQYELIRASIQSADYAIANLETTVGLYSDKPYSGYPLFNAPEELLVAVKDAGFDFLTLANNHILDRYFDGMVQTIDLVERHGFDFGGANRSREEQAAPKVVVVNGIKIGMLCYTQGTNGMEDHADARAAEFGVNYLKTSDFSADVRAVREAGAEVVIAMVHWGREYRRAPSTYQKHMAKRLCAAGVDVILGSHPHVVQPAGLIEGIDADGTKREALIAFSLGNFNSYMSADYTYSGIILEFTLTEREEGGFAITDVGYVPTYCWRQDNAVQTLSSAQYYEIPPPGMPDKRVRQMRRSYTDLVELMGKDLKVLEK